MIRSRGIANRFVISPAANVSSGRRFKSHHRLQKGIELVRFLFSLYGELTDLRDYEVMIRSRGIADRFVISPSANVSSGREFKSHHQLQKESRHLGSFFFFGLANSRPCVITNHDLLAGDRKSIRNFAFGECFIRS